MEGKEDNWARFNALLEVAEEERIKFEEKKAEAKERKEGNLRSNLYIISKFLPKIGEENSDESKRAAQSFDLSTYQTGKRSARKKTSSTDTLNQLFQFPISSKKLSDMPCPKKAKAPIMAIPESIYFDGNIWRHPLKRLRDEDESEMTGAKKAKKLFQKDEPVPPLPESLRNKIRAIGGSESTVTLVFQKVLTATDVSFHQSRLLMPFKQVKDHSFLTQKERDLLGKRYVTTEEGIKNDSGKIPVILIDPECDEHQLNLTRWDMGKGVNNVSSNYSLLTRWTDVVKKNHLKAGDLVQVWGFRKVSDLGFALAVL